MKILALDTTNRVGSAALVVDGAIVEERPGDSSRTHAERLPGELLSLLDAHALSPASVELFAVAVGPGLFTGLRIGIATMQGLALVGKRPIAGVSALLALGHLAARDRAAGTRIGVWMDAHRRDVFASLFEIGPAPDFAPERLIEREGATVGDPQATIERWMRRGELPAVMIGDGAHRYRAVIEQADPQIVIAPDTVLAGAVAMIALARARIGDVTPPAGVQPLYVRRPDAELAREHALADRSADLARPD